VALKVCPGVNVPEIVGTAEFVRIVVYANLIARYLPVPEQGSPKTVLFAPIVAEVCPTK
jgi:hypothetical protein